MCIFSTPTTRQILASFSADRVRFQRAFVPSIRTGGLRALLLRIKNEYPVTVSNSFHYQYQCCPHWCQAFKHKNRTNMSKHQQHLPVFIKTCCSFTAFCWRCSNILGRMQAGNRLVVPRPGWHASWKPKRKASTQIGMDRLSLPRKKDHSSTVLPLAHGRRFCQYYFLCLFRCFAPEGVDGASDQPFPSLELYRVDRLGQTIVIIPNCSDKKAAEDLKTLKLASTCTSIACKLGRLERLWANAKCCTNKAIPMANLQAKLGSLEPTPNQSVALRTKHVSTCFNWTWAQAFYCLGK